MRWVWAGAVANYLLGYMLIAVRQGGSAAALPQQGKYEDHRHFSLLTTRPPRQKLSALRHVGAPSTVRVEKVAPRPKRGAFGRPGRAAAKAKRI